MMRKDAIQSLIIQYEAQQGVRRKLFPKEIILLLKACLLDFVDSDDVTWGIFEDYLADKNQSRLMQDINWAHDTGSVKLLKKIKDSSELSQNLLNLLIYSN